MLRCLSNVRMDVTFFLLFLGTDSFSLLCRGVGVVLDVEEKTGKRDVENAFKFRFL